MPKFNAVYGYVLKPSNGLQNDDDKWGEGQMELDIDKEPETQEEWTEVARAIGLEGGYASVSVTHLVPLDDIYAFAAASKNTVLEGEIVDSE